MSKHARATGRDIAMSLEKEGKKREAKKAYCKYRQKATKLNIPGVSNVEDCEEKREEG